MLEVAREWGDPVTILITESRFGRARWFLIGSTLGFVTGIGAVFRNIRMKDVDRVSQGTTSALSFLLIFMFLAFWRVKRQDRLLRVRVREAVRRADEAGRKDGDG